MKCPHCLFSYHDQMHEVHIGDGGNNEGYWLSRHQVCPECDRSIIFVEERKQSKTLKEILVYPKTVSRDPLPSEVQDPLVISDYNEACLVLQDSPKASAALSRRCLQYILREKVGVKEKNLDQEIQKVLDQHSLPSNIADNLDAIRNIGNFAAHPIKIENTGEIVEVEPQEAEWNINVLFELIDFYYVRPAISKKKREDLNKKLVKAGKSPLK